MHIADMDLNILGCNGVVGAGLPIANGAGLSSRLRRSDQVTVCFFGDGASSQGTFHEALNLAAVWKLPVVFVCENNQYALSTSYKRTVAVDAVADRAVAYGIPGVTVDGNDVFETYAAAKEMVESARSGGGTQMLEVVTYRRRGHAEHDDQRYQPKAEIAEWEQKDPIARFRQYLQHKKLWSEAFEQECVETAKAEIAAAVKAAEALPNPAPETLFDDVTMNLSPQLKEQRQELHDLMAKGGVGAAVGFFPL